MQRRPIFTVGIFPDLRQVNQVRRETGTRRRHSASSMNAGADPLLKFAGFAIVILFFISFGGLINRVRQLNQSCGFCWGEVNTEDGR